MSRRPPSITLIKLTKLCFLCGILLHGASTSCLMNCQAGKAGNAESIIFSMCVHAQALQSCLTLCDPMDCSLPGSSVRGVLQARILEWVAMPSSKGSSQPRNRTYVSSTAGNSLPTEPPGRLCNPMDYTVHGIPQARILEWVAFLFFRGSSQPRDQTQVSHIAGGFFTS